MCAQLETFHGQPFFYEYPSDVDEKHVDENPIDEEKPLIDTCVLIICIQPEELGQQISTDQQPPTSVIHLLELAQKQKEESAHEVIDQQPLLGYDDIQGHRFLSLDHKCLLINQRNFIKNGYHELNYIQDLLIEEQIGHTFLNKKHFMY